MAFINLRRKKGIYLGGDMRMAFLSLSHPFFFFFHAIPVFLSSVCCSAKPSAAKSTLTASLAAR